MQLPTSTARSRTVCDVVDIERFNRKLRDECLNVHWFINLEDALEKIERRRIEDNAVRPHGSLDDQTPVDRWHDSDAPRRSSYLDQ